MAKTVIVVVFFLVLGTVTIPIYNHYASTKALPPAPTVLIQDGDTCYHNANCKLLKEGKERSCKEEDAVKRGYHRCVPCFVDKDAVSTPTVMTQEGDGFFHRVDCKRLMHPKARSCKQEVAIEQGFRPCVICLVENTLLDPQFHRDMAAQQAALLEQEYYKQPKVCPFCAKTITYEHRDWYYCSQECADNYQLWLSNQQAECRKQEFNQSVSEQRREREHAMKQPVGALTSEDAYRSNTGVSWNGGGVRWNIPPNRER
jgi:hypothetical protein